jgi:hypothetical protein
MEIFISLIITALLALGMYRNRNEVEHRIEMIRLLRSIEKELGDLHSNAVPKETRRR